MAGLFDTFTIAKRGLNVQQGNITTTSHNIANANTTGFSRQRAVAETTKPFGGMSRFDTAGVGQVGTGAEITSIQRIRDYFIDYQVRSESGTSGYYTQTSETLSKVEDVFGEPSDTGIQELINKFFNSFQEVAKNSDKSDVKTVALQNASSLADALNYTYNQLKKSCEDSQSLLKANVTDVNSYLNQINELNKQIRSISAVGQTPNDLMDKRDNLLDELSYKFGVKVDRDNLEAINLSSTEYPDSPLVKSNPNDIDYYRLSYIKNATFDKTTGDVKVDYYPLGNENVEVKSFTITGGNQELADKLNECKILIGDKDGVVGTTITTSDPITGKVITTTTPFTTTSISEVSKKLFQTYKHENDESGTAINNVDNNNIKGQIAANQSVQNKIKKYMDSLDRLAAGLAYSVNAIQTGSLDDSKSTQGLSNNLIFVTYDESNQSNTNNDKGITAKNIRINSKLLKDPTLLNCNTTSTSGEGDGKRAAAIANLSSVKMNLSSIEDSTDLTKIDRATFLSKVGISGFKDGTSLELNAKTDGSTVDTYYKSIINNLSVEIQEANRQVNNQASVLSNLQDQKASVSGVSLDEEMTNLIQFQHAYQANAKMISTVNELLDVVINGLKR